MYLENFFSCLCSLANIIRDVDFYWILAVCETESEYHE